MHANHRLLMQPSVCKFMHRPWLWLLACSLSYLPPARLPAHTCLPACLQSLDVLLLALCAIQRLREAASVLRGCRELSDLALNLAVSRAESWALTLSSLTVSLEFPPYDPGCGSEGYGNIQGSAAAMPLAQVGADGA